MNKQTAIEWLWNNLTDDMIGELSPEQIKSIYQLIEQAKEMEKEQIEGAYIDGAMGAFDKTYKGMHEYYNENYGGDK